MLTAIALWAALASAPAGPEPTDAEVLHALPGVPLGVPFVWEKYRDNITIVKNRVAPPQPPAVLRFLGVAAGSELESWQCVVYYDDVTQMGYPAKTVARKTRVEVVYIDRAKLAK